jgi:hypothetical protein
LRDIAKYDRNKGTSDRAAGLVRMKEAEQDIILLNFQLFKQWNRASQLAHAQNRMSNLGPITLLAVSDMFIQTSNVSLALLLMRHLWVKIVTLAIRSNSSAMSTVVAKPLRTAHIRI